MFAVRISPRIANSLDMSKVGVGVSAVEHPAGAEPDLSPNVEMYLKVIVRLYGGDGPVSTSAVARELAVSAPSASVMLKRLDADGFVTHEGRQGVIPTPLGSRVGAITLRRQLLAERLLVDRLGISWEVATGEACRLEHAISPLVEQQLAAFLESPSTCPHGHPIPHADGRIWRHDDAIALTDLDLDAEATVLAVPHDMPELLRFLAETKIGPGANVTLRQRDRIVGLLTLDVDGRSRVVSLPLANNILMRKPS